MWIFGFLLALWGTVIFKYGIAQHAVTVTTVHAFAAGSVFIILGGVAIIAGLLVHKIEKKKHEKQDSI